METIYFAAVTTSNELAKIDGPYSSFKGSPTSKGIFAIASLLVGSHMREGIFQFDMWDVSPSERLGWDWEALRASVITHGLRNSLLIAPMPTASTSQILGNNECFEPYTSNVSSTRPMPSILLLRHLLQFIDIHTPCFSWRVYYCEQAITDRFNAIRLVDPRGAQPHYCRYLSPCGHLAHY